MTHGTRLLGVFGSSFIILSLFSSALAASPVGPKEVRCHQVPDWSADTALAPDVIVSRKSAQGITLTYTDEPFDPAARTLEGLTAVNAKVEARRGFPYGQFDGRHVTETFGPKGATLQIHVLDLEKRGVYRAIFSGSAVAVPYLRSSWMALCYE